MPTENRSYVVTGIRLKRTRSSGETDGIPGPTDSGTYVVVVDKVTVSQTRTGNPVSNYKWRIKNHHNATSAFVGVAETYSPGSGFAEASWRFNAGGNTWVHTISGGWLRAGRPANPDTLATAAATEAAKIEFLGEVRKAQTAFQGGVFLGEISKTLSLIRNPAQIFQRGLHSYLAEIRGYAYRGGKRAALKKASKLWLEYQFGWKQLYNDTLDGAKALSRLTKEPFIKKIGPVQGSGGQNVVVSNGSWIQSSPFNYKVSDVETSEVTVQLVGAVRVNNSGLGAARQFGLWPSEFAPTLWELIPYSFVVDYFTNVGDMINAAAANTASIAWNSATRKSLCRTETRIDADLMSTPNGAKELYRFNSLSPSVRERKSILRYSIEDWSINPVSGFELSTPGSSTKWLNLAALIGAGRATSRVVSQIG